MFKATQSFPFRSKKDSLLIGYSLVLMALLAGFAYGFVHQKIYVSGDSKLTVKLLQENLSLYKFGLISWVMIVILDAIVSIGLYQIYKSTHKALATSTSGLRIIYTVFLGLATFQLAIPLIDNNEKVNGLLYFDSFEYIWSLGLVLFGFHLLSLGVICFKSKFTPKFWGILLSFGGICYVLVHILKSFFPHFNATTSTIESVLMAPMALGELGFAVWLIVKATRIKKIEL